MSVFTSLIKAPAILPFDVMIAVGDLTRRCPASARAAARICALRADGPRRPDHQGERHVHPPRAGRRIGKRHGELGRLHLVVTREGEADAMTLKAECASPGDAIKNELAATLRSVTKLGGNVALVAMGSLPMTAS
jgi:phenylacetate-CoA ligase